MLGTNEQEYNPNSKLKADNQEVKFFGRGTTFNDIYEVANRTIQKGGQGEVVLCKNKLDKKYYVLKTFQGDKNNKKEFEKEIEFSLKLEKNPYVVYTQTAFQEEDKTYMVMELVGKQPKTFEEEWKSSTLRDIIVNINKEKNYRYAIEFCKGMQYLNSIGMKSHKDIKPENIFITEDNHIKIADFGLVGLKDNGSGTEGYRSPEQARKEETNIQSDIYSFGVILYEMLNDGINPYNETKTNLKEEDFILKEYEKEHPSKSCKEIIQKCGEKEQKDRYKDFKELEEDLLKEAKKELGKEFEVENLPIKELTAEDYFYKAIGYENITRYVVAVKYYDNTIKCDSNSINAYFNKGFRESRSLKIYEDAIKNFDKVIGFNDNDYEAYNNRGLCKSKLGLYRSAIEDFDKAISIAPNFIGAHLNRWNIVVLIKSFEDTIKSTGNNIEEDDEYILFHRPIDPNKEQLGKFEYAIKELENALYNNKISSVGMVKIKEYLQFFENINKLLELDKNNIYFINTLGNIYKYIREYEKAIKEYKRAISINKEQILSYKNLIEVYKILGKNKEVNFIENIIKNRFV